jgi:hypothetical protein
MILAVGGGSVDMIAVDGNATLLMGLQPLNRASKIVPVNNVERKILHIILHDIWVLTSGF